MARLLLKNIARFFPEGKLTRSLREIFSQHLDKKWYKINKIIKRVNILDDGLICIELNNGLIFYDKQIRNRREEKTYKLVNKNRLSNIKEPNVYQQIYLRIHNEFVLNHHLKPFSLNPGDIVVDAGANIGSFTIKAANIVGNEGRVIAIEPEKENLKILKKNVDANNLTNVSIVPKGLWSKKGTMSFYLNDYPGLHSLFNSTPGKPSKKPYEQSPKTKCPITEIKIDTLDNIIDELEIERTDFIKMDIEGAEIEALQGANKTLARKKLKLVIEAGHIVNGEQTYKIIAPWLREKGFRIVKIDKKQQGTIFAIKTDHVSPL